MKTAIYAGSFDPITNGHIDIIKRSLKIFDKVIIAVAYNINKSEFLPVNIRKELILKSISDISNVEVDSFDGLTIDYAKQKGANFLLRGVRSALDFEYETQLAQINKKLNENIETVILTATPELGCVSSSAVREILKNKNIGAKECKKEDKSARIVRYISKL